MNMPSVLLGPTGWGGGQCWPLPLGQTFSLTCQGSLGLRWQLWLGEHRIFLPPSHAPHNCLSLKLRSLLERNSVCPKHPLFPGTGLSKE